MIPSSILLKSRWKLSYTTRNVWENQIHQRQHIPPSLTNHRLTLMLVHSFLLPIYFLPSLPCTKKQIRFLLCTMTRVLHLCLSANYPRRTHQISSRYLCQIILPMMSCRHCFNPGTNYFLSNTHWKGHWSDGGISFNLIRRQLCGVWFIILLFFSETSCGRWREWWFK